MRNKILALCTKLVCNYPLTIVILFISISIISIISAVNNLKISTDYDALRSQDLEYVKKYHKVKTNFGDNNFLLIVIESGNNKQKGKEIADIIANKLNKLHSVKKIFHKVNLDFFKQNSLLFLKTEDYNTINTTLKNTKYEINKLGQINNINSFLKYFINRLSSNNTSNIDTLILYYFIKEFNLNLETENKQSIIKNLLQKKTQEFEEEGYFFSDNKKLLFILALTEKDYSSIDLMQEPLKDIRTIISSVQKQYKNIPIGITGQPVIQSDEMSITSKETSYAALISIILVSLIFTLSLRNIPRSLLAVSTLLISIIITFGIASIYPGRLTILSIVFTVMMVGLGIDFSIHIISRYHEELYLKNSVFTSIEHTILKAGKSNLSAIVASVIAFYAALFVDFQGIKELGFIAGTGIIVILFSTLLLLPSLLILYDRKKIKLQASPFVRVLILHKIITYPKTVVITTLTITLIFIAIILFKGTPKFNNNLMDLQAHGIESVEYEMKLISNSSGSSWLSTLIVSNNLKENDQTIAKLSTKNTVGKIESLRDYIPSKQKESIQKAAQLKQNLISIINKLAKQPTNPSIPQIKQNIKTIKHLLTNFYKKNQNNDNIENLLFNVKDETFVILDKLYQKLNDKKAINKVTNFQNRFFDDIFAAFATVKDFLNPTPITIHNLPNLIKFRFIGKDNKILSYVLPKNNIWLEDELKQYIKDIREVTPDVTGSAINFYEDTKRMKEGFENITIYVLVIVFILLIADFRSVLHSIIALIPLAIGMTWLLGIMSAANIYFNIGNSFSIPLLIGISIAYGIHVVHRFIEDGNALFITKSTGTAVILTALTTIIGFASLLIASHRGTFSLGLVMSIGIASSFLTSILFLPALLELIKNKIRQ